MVQTSYPGVYLQEKSSGVRTITGVATSITSFLGRATKGQMNKAVRCFSPADFIRSFGAPHPESDLSPAVRQFFDNGGTDAYVVRIAAGASKAALTVKNLAGTDVLNVTALSEGSWGANLRLEVDYNTPTPDETFTLRVLLEDEGQVVASETHSNLSMDSKSARFAPTFVTQNSELATVELNAAAGDPNNGASTYFSANPAGFSQSRRLMTDETQLRNDLNTAIAAGKTNFDISIDGSPYKTVTLATVVAPASPLAHIKAQIEALFLTVPGTPKVSVTLTPGANGYLRITAATPGPTPLSNAYVRVRRSANADLAGTMMLGIDQGGIEPARWSPLRPKPTGTVLLLDAAGAMSTTLTDALAVLGQGVITKLTIDGTDIDLSPASGFPLVTTVGGDPWSKNKAGAAAITGDNDGVREKLRLIANAINAQVLLKYRAEAFGYHLAIIPKEGDVTKKPVLSVTAAAPAFTNALAINDRRLPLAGGNDGNAPTITEFVGDQNNQTGFHALDPVDLFNLMVLPRDEKVPDSQMEDIYGQASIYCQSRRAFLLMDPPRDWTSTKQLAAVVQDPTKVNGLRGKVIKDYSAVFYPGLTFNDRGLQRTVGPTGALAGLFSRTDASRGVWKAPAGTEADLRGITGFEVKLTDRENGVLNKQGVNCLRNFPSGFVSWGTRTMDGLDDLASEWKYIPIRRLALFLEESLYRGTQWAVFEPNDEPLWAKLRLNIGAFMNGLFRQGAFQGATPAEAFYVKCDKDTTTQNDRNLGIVNIEIGFAPLKPAEFVVITIQQMAGDLK